MANTRLNKQVRAALIGLSKADKMPEAAATAKADRHLAAAVARVSIKKQGVASVMEWRKACADLRSWIRTKS
jgi:hypothetical protein